LVRAKDPCSRASILSGKLPVMVDPETDNRKGIEAVIVEPETVPETARVNVPESTNMQLPFESRLSCHSWEKVSEPAKLPQFCRITRVAGPLLAIGAGVPFAHELGETALHMTISFIVPDHVPVRST
jgi:hypothetical protein